MKLLVSFRRRGCIISGPWDLPAFIALIDFKTISGEVSVSISGSLKYLHTFYFYLQNWGYC